MEDKGTEMLETKRLILRKFVLDDYEQVYKNYGCDERVTKYVMWYPHKNKEETKELVSKWIEKYDQENVYNWAVVEKESNEVIGSISVVHSSIKNMTAEVGYVYGYDYWGKGYATEALKAVIDYLHDIGFVVVEAGHVLENIASGKVMAKAGMKYEATLKSRIKCKDDTRKDEAIYSSIRE